MDEKKEHGLTELDVALAALTDRQRLFAQLVADGVPQTEAVKRAGYAHKHAASMASHLRRDPKVDRALKALTELKDDMDETSGPELVERRLLEISATGTPASRVSALTALQKIYDARRAQTGEKSLLRTFRELPPAERRTMLFERVESVIKRVPKEDLIANRELLFRVRNLINEVCGPSASSGDSSVDIAGT